jgi:putative ABC transport system permease protein
VTTGNDIRFAIRLLKKNPGFTAAATLTLALGIGANLAMFSVVRGLLLKPLGFPHPERLMTLWEKDQHGAPDNLGWLTYSDWRRQSKSFEEISVASYWNPILTGDGDAAQVEGLRVSNGFFRTLGVGPMLGRDFTPEEDRPKHNRVAILSYGLFARRFGADRNILGKPIYFGDTPYTVVGVLPKTFESVFSTNFREPAEIWAPLGYDASSESACRTCRHLRAFGRLKPGVTLNQARAELDSVSADVVRAFPKDYSAPGTIVNPLTEQLYGTVRPALLIFLGAVSLVLLMACANVTSLLLSRSVERRREVGVRAALGAGRGRLLRMLLTESALLGLLGGALGLLVASIIERSLIAAAPASLPRLAAVGFDGVVLAAGFLLSLMTGLVLGLAPAIKLSRISAGDGLHESRGASAGRERRLFLGGLVVADVALAIVLLLGAGLLIRSVSRLFQVDPGFDPRGLLKLEIQLSGSRYREDANVHSFYQGVLERVRTLPGVSVAGLASQVPLGGNRDGWGAHLEDKPNSNPELDPMALRYAVSAGYLEAMKIPIKRGRTLTEADRAGSLPVILFNESFVKKTWPGENPIGKRVKFGGLDSPWRTVVGVAGDVRHEGLDSPVSPEFYVPESQWLFSDTDLVLVIRASGNSEGLAAAARRAILSVDSRQAVNHIATMESVVSESAASRRFALIVLAAFAAMAVLLASVGVYGIVARSVAQRRREFGIRLALGATGASILRLVTSGSLRAVLAGVALGLAAALALSRLITSLLFQVSPHDAATVVSTAALMIGVGLVASVLPARRAAKVDPMLALREE